MRLEAYSTAGQTMVPNVFIDQYMAEANGEFVKVYLCLLRMQGTAEVSVQVLAEKLDLSERTVNRALNYLEKQGLLKLFYDADGAMSGIRMLSGEDIAAGAEAAAENAAGVKSAADNALPRTPAAEEPGMQDPAKKARSGRRKPAEPADRSSQVPAAPERRSYLPTEISRLCEEDEEFNMLVSVVAPAYLNRPTDNNDNDIFAWLYHDVGLPVDVLEYCIEQCVERRKGGHTDKAFVQKYFKKVALDWHEQGVKDLESAREAVRRFDENARGQKEGATRPQSAAGAQPAEGDKGRKKAGVGRSERIQKAYGFSTERGDVDYNAVAWSRMWEEK